MAKAEVDQQSSHRRQNRFLVVLLLVAALVSAAKDLGRLHDLTSGLVGLAASVHERVNTAMTSPGEPACQPMLAENDRSGQPYNWNGRVAPDQLLQMKDGSATLAAVGGTLELIASHRSSCRASAMANDNHGQVAQMATEAVHRVPNRNAGGFGRRASANQLATIRVRNHNRRLNFILRMPAEVEFVSRTISDEIEANWIDNNLGSIKVCPLTSVRFDSLPVNGRLNTTGPLQAISGSAVTTRTAEPNCLGAIELRTADGIISLDLLRILRATLGAEELNDGAASEFPRTLKGKLQRTTVAPAAEESH